MKTIKVKYVGYWDNYEYERTVLYHILTKHYNVELSENPDYIICGIFGKLYDYCQYPQIRILDCGENYIPDFNLVDYAISRYPLSFQDRHLYVPGAISCEMPTAERFRQLKDKDRDYPDSVLKEKDLFANFICSHESEGNIRGDFFKELCKYKKVTSVGPYLNNTDNAVHVKWADDSKPAFQKRCKFSLCFESTKHEGFVTEKISDAFFADTIPVYFGSSDVKRIFNSEAFIYCTGRDGFEDAINQIIELDNNDNKYMEMLRKPILNDPDYYEKKMNEYERFIFNIFEQPLETAYRRSRVFWPKTYDDYLSWVKNPKSYQQIPYQELIRALGRKIINKVKR